jgi:FkbM family methyltransferase
MYNLKKILCALQIGLLGRMNFKDKYGNHYVIPKNQRWRRTLNKGVHTDDDGLLMISQALVRNFIIKKANINIIDIGACVGVVSLSVAKMLRDVDKVFCIEPEKANYDLMLTNIELNHHLRVNITPFNIAIGDFDGEIYLSINHNNYGGHQIALEKKKDAQKIGCLKLSSFCESHDINEIDILKIDAESYDTKIIMSSKDLFQQEKVISLFVECQKNEEFFEIEAFLKDCGYLLFYVVRDSKEVHSSYSDWKQYESRTPLNMLAILESQYPILTNSDVVIHG